MFGRSIKENKALFVIETHLRIIDTSVEWPNIDAIDGSGKPKRVGERVCFAFLIRARSGKRFPRF
jgi:hypothetical protein